MRGRILVNCRGERWNLSPQFWDNIRKLRKSLNKSGLLEEKNEEESDIIEP
jgi:hypothetical protein